MRGLHSCQGEREREREHGHALISGAVRARGSQVDEGEIDREGGASVEVGGRLSGQIFSSHQDVRPDRSSFETGSLKKICGHTVQLLWRGWGGRSRRWGRGAGGGGILSAAAAQMGGKEGVGTTC